MAIEFDIITITQKNIKDVDFNNIIMHVHFSETIDMERSKEFHICFQTVIKGGMKKIVVDMSNLEYIDSSGISILINTAKLLRSRGGDIALLHVDEEISKIFKVINFERFIKMFQNYDEAVNFFRYVI